MKLSHCGGCDITVVDPIKICAALWPLFRPNLQGVGIESRRHRIVATTALLGGIWLSILWHAIEGGERPIGPVGSCIGQAVFRPQPRLLHAPATRAGAGQKVWAAAAYDTPTVKVEPTKHATRRRLGRAPGRPSQSWHGDAGCAISDAILQGTASETSLS